MKIKLRNSLDVLDPLQVALLANAPSLEKLSSKKQSIRHIKIFIVCELSHLQLFVTPWTVAPPGSSVHGILQARTLQWAAMPSSRGSSDPGTGSLWRLLRWQDSLPAVPQCFYTLCSLTVHLLLLLLSRSSRV